MGWHDSVLAGNWLTVRSMAERSVSSSVLSGSNPVEFDSSNPITLFIVQLFIILVFTQGLGWAFGYIKQPRVIAEVIGGIILGPTVFGRIPHFSNDIFPPPSLPYLNLIATIGLILFLFLVGLEVDIGVMKRNGRAAALISAAGMILPFGVGAGVAVPVYHNFVNTEKVSFGHFLLFSGVAMSITAFPVLCRILVSTKLLDTKVGVIVLAAGVGNDVVGWVLLALTLALVNAKAGVTAVYVLLCAVGWAIVLLWPIKKGFRWLVRRSGSLEHGPTPGMMILTLLIVFASAFITDIIGVHPIFGGFIAGLIIPHEGGFAIALVEKIDDLVSMLFLPIYFVLSGLSTNLGLLNTGKDWGYIVLLCTVAFLGKFIGCAGMAYILRYPIRESGAIGMLMSCKGLVELIVLNVGYQAGIIDQRLFSMFVVEAVVLTFITTPFTLLIYPERVRSRATADLNPVRDHEKGEMAQLAASLGSRERDPVSRFLVVLQKLEHLAPLMLLTQMLELPSPKTKRAPGERTSLGKVYAKTDADLDETDSDFKSSALEGAALPTVSGQSSRLSSIPITIDALKLIELTGRTFSVMQSAEKDQLLLTDDALQLYRQFGRLRGLEVNPHIDIVGQDSFPSAVADFAQNLSTQMVIIPWTVPSGSSSALLDPSPAAAEREGIVPSSSFSPFDSVFGSETQGSPMYTHFVRRVFSECQVDKALFVDRGFSGGATFAPGSGQHIFMPFFGGPDDRLALKFVVQLCHHANVTATVVKVEKSEDLSAVSSSVSGKVGLEESMEVHREALQRNQLTVGPTSTTFPDSANRLASDTADNIAWSYYTSPSTLSTRPSSLESILRRISFCNTKSPSPLSMTSDYAESVLASSPGPMWRPMLIVAGRGRRGAALNHSDELSRVLTERGLSPTVGAELRKTVGDVAAGLMLGGGAAGMASFLVVEVGGQR
ncbi:potassium:hydrogen antiporter [Tremella mesenterica]|uniref:Potassium:hydrogen antiporter n=1 Tax=Tremella mesenterica TaxID=5217 RepID=A0A4Q1B843_TREME|nr:potassium:hydrogen antiporter [Tremella mesenterica]